MGFDLVHSDCMFAILKYVQNMIRLSDIQRGIGRQLTHNLLNLKAEFPFTLIIQSFMYMSEEVYQIMYFTISVCQLCTKRMCG